MTVSTEYTDCPFEAGFFGRPVWRLAEAGNAVGVVEGAKAANVGLISCRVPEGSETSELVAAGFRLVEILVTLRAEIWRVDEVPKDIRRAHMEDAVACGEVARVAFKADRFHQDPEFSDDIANDIKATWVENSVKGRANAVFCAEINREIVGFNACLFDGDDAVIDLIGVHPQVQGQGIGTKLLDIMALHYRGRASHIRLGTQLSNEASMEFYDSLGFSEVSRAQTWHWTP